MVGLTNLRFSTPSMLPKLNRRRALFVLTKIDEILAWEQRKDAERDTKFVELGRYLCEVRAGQYWRLENLKSFDEFLERRFPESRRKAYYLMSIHDHLPPQARKELKEVGWTKGRELAKLARAEGQHFNCAPWVHKARTMPREQFQREVEKELTGRETEPRGYVGISGRSLRWTDISVLNLGPYHWIVALALVCSIAIRKNGPPIRDLTS